VTPVARAEEPSDDDARAVARRPIAAGRARSTTTDRWTLLLLAGAVAYLVAALLRLAVDGHPLSVIDEHVHLDTQLEVHDGTFPYRGSRYGDGLIEEWACGAGHEAGALAKPCGDPTLGPADLPSGQYTSGYIHYPTYFVGGEAFRRLVESVAGPQRPLDVYRAYAALLMALGVMACGIVSWRLRLRGPALLGGTLAPVSAAAILLYGTTVNPTSSAVLTGALLGGAGLRWVLTGRGYRWLLAATALAACVAVTDSLPAGAFIIAIVVALVLRRSGRSLDSPWQPRWWHAALLAGVVVVPVLAWGQVIAHRATIPDSTLYAAYGFESWTPVVSDSLRELFTLHSPWNQASVLEAGTGRPLNALVRAAGYGIPLWVTVLVFGTLVLGTLGVVRRAPAAAPSARDPRGPASSLRVLAASTLAAVVLYPPALHVSNAVTGGFNTGIVDRYSISFAPLLVWLALLLTRDRPAVAGVLAALSVVCVISVGAVA